MPDAKLESDKETLIKSMTEAYARGSMDMDACEGAVTRISACPDSGALATEIQALGLAMPLVPRPAYEGEPMPSSRLEPIRLDCVSGSIRKSGDWVASGVYRIALRSSSARLDLREYRGAGGFRLVLEIDAASSSLRLIVPVGFQVEDRFSGSISSTVRNRPKGESVGDNRIALIGNLRSSSVRVKYSYS